MLSFTVPGIRPIYCVASWPGLMTYCWGCWAAYAAFCCAKYCCDGNDNVCGIGACPVGPGKPAFDAKFGFCERNSCCNDIKK